MRPRRPLLTVLAALTSLSPVGCKDADESARKHELRFWTMQLRPTFDEYVTGLIRSWEAKHPGVHVKWVDLPANEIENKTLTAAASGRVPDLVNLNPMFSNKLATARALVPLQLPPAVKARYFPAAFEANTVREAIIGVPWYLSTSITLYNTSLWQAAGLAPGAWPQDYRGLAQAARQIRARTGKYGFLPAFGDRGKLLELMALDGVPLLAADRKHAAFDGPAGREAMRFWVGLFQDGTLPQEALTQNHREGIDRFQAGQVAALPAGPQFLKMLRQNAPQLYADLGLGPQIGGASGAVGMQVMNLVIPVASRQPDLALDLALHVTSGSNQLAFCQIVPILPSVKATVEDPFFLAAPEAALEERARALAAAQLKRATLLVPPLYRQAELAKSLDSALQRAVLKQQTADEALQQAAEEWAQILASS